MLNDTTNRGLLYGLGGAVLAGLLYVGFVYEAEPDAMTLMGSANIQLRLAHGLPATAADGRPVAAREELLDQAAINLERAGRQLPDSPVLAEFQGFLEHLRGNHVEAAQSYRRARGLPGCSPEQRDALIFNEARMLAAGGDAAAALAVMREHGDEVADDLAVQRALEEAGYMAALDRDADAAQRLQFVVDTDQPMAWTQAALQFEAMGDTARAVELLDRAGPRVPVADYHLARLKLAGGDVDTCLRLLERAVEASPGEVRRLVREDPVAWQGVAANARFQELAAPVAATPGR